MGNTKKPHRAAAARGTALLVGLMWVVSSVAQASPEHGYEPYAGPFTPLTAPPQEAPRIVESSIPLELEPIVDGEALGPRPSRSERPQGQIQPTTTATAEHLPSISSSSLAGVASWYCLPGRSRCTRGHDGGLYAAIRRDLLHLRGQTVEVCAASRCVSVTIIDCNCGAGANLIDLYADAFRVLAPLDRGRISVTMRLPG